MDGETIEMKPVETDTSVTDREGLDVATGGVQTTTFMPPTEQAHYNYVKRATESATNWNVHKFQSFLNRHGYIMNNMKYNDFNLIVDDNGKVQEFSYRKAGKDFDRDVVLTKKGSYGEFKSINTILRELGVGGQRKLGIEPDVVRARMLEETSRKNANIEHIKSLSEQSTQATDKEKEQLQRELGGYKKALDTIDGQLKLAKAERDDISRQIKHEEEKLKRVKKNELESNMSPEALDQRIADLQAEYNARTDQIEALTAKQRSQVEQIKGSVHRFLNKESGSLRERIATLFREQGVTIFSIVTAIGMTIGVLVEALIPGGLATAGGGGSSAPSSGVKEWLKKKLETLKNLLKTLANKFGAALPGILGSIVSWIFNTLPKVVGAVAQNLWTLFLAAGYLIYDVYRRS